MYIKIANLSDGDHFFEFIDDVSKIGLKPPFTGEFKARVKLSKSHSQIILNTDLEVPAEFECDRCTENFNISLNTHFQIVYLFSKDRMESTDSYDVIYLSPEADVIDISDELRDFALLAVPMKKLCSEDCKGLCSNCGMDLNTGSCDCEEAKTDPRWEPLLKLKEKINNN